MHRLAAILAMILTVLTLGACSTAGPSAPVNATLPPAAAPATAAVTGAGSHLAVIPYTVPLTVTGHYPAHCRLAIVNALPHPDPACTPGAVGDRVTQATIATTICKPNWTATVRPDRRLTAQVKTAALIAYGIPAARRAKTELDHFVPLILGGADDVTNLWPQPADLAGSVNTKDAIETALGKAVCDHRVTLAAARVAIVADWTTARSRLGV